MKHRFNMKGICLRPTIFVNNQKRISTGLIVLVGLLFLAHPMLVAAAGPPDPVLEWNAIMNDTVLAGGTSPLLTSRVVALVSASVTGSNFGLVRRPI